MRTAEPLRFRRVDPEYIEPMKRVYVPLKDAKLAGCSYSRRRAGSRSKS